MKLLGGVLMAQELLDCPDEPELTGTFREVVDEIGTLRHEGCRPAAHDLAELLLVAAERDYGLESLEVADALDLLADSHYWLAQRDDLAIERARRAERIRRDHPGVDPVSLARNQRILGSLLAALDDPDLLEQALEHYDEAHRLWQAELGAESVEMADLLQWVGELVDDWGAGGPAAARRLPWVEELLDPATAAGKSVLEIWEQLTANAGGSRSGELALPDDPALALVLRSVFLARLADPGGPVLGEALNILGLLLEDRQLYDEALLAYQESFDARVLAHPPNHPQVARAHHNLGLALMWVGRLDEARRYLEDGYEMRLALSNPRFPATIASSLRGLGQWHFFTGDLNGAVTLYLEALPKLREVYGQRRYAEALVNLAEVYEALRQPAAAASRYREALAALATTASPDGAETAAVKTKLGTLLVATGEGEAGEALLREARETQESLPEIPVADYARTLRGLARIESGSRPRRALALYRESAEALASYRGSHPELPEALLEVAALELKTGDPGAARRTLDRAADLLADLGEAAWVTPRLYLLRARTAAASDQPRQALGEAAEAARLYGEHLAPATRILAPDAALAFASQNRESLNLALTLLAASRPTAGTIHAVWESVARSRGLVADELERRYRLARRTRDPELRERLATLHAARRDLADTQFRIRRAESEHEREVLLRWAETRMRAAEDSLAREIERARLDADTFLPPVGSAFGSSDRVTLAELLAELPERGALLAYVRFDDSEAAGGSARYGAFVATAGSSEARFVDLGAAEPIDRQVRDWRSALVPLDGSWTVAESIVRRRGAALKRTLWEPAVEHAGDARRLFVIPDGSLFLVPFAALPGSTADRYLVEEGYELHRLVSERDLARRPRPPRPQRLLAVGGPSYDAGASPAVLAELPPRPSLIERWRETTSSFFSDYLRDPCRGGVLDFLPLPAARAEAAEIASIFSRTGAGGSPAGRVTHLSEAAATESAFKRLAPSFTVLHVATHAFFDLKCRSGSSSRGLGDLLLETPWAKLPARPSSEWTGLAFAGANRPRGTVAAEDDGILTLSEIDNLDLSDVEWVVLSACQTALGQVVSGEGVLGLARSFRVAGADTLVLSLWPVADSATRDWMRELYRARFARRLPTAAALRAASLAVLEERRRTRRSTHPFHWAAFVAMGDWD